MSGAAQSDKPTAEKSAEEYGEDFVRSNDVAEFVPDDEDDDGVEPTGEDDMADGDGDEGDFEDSDAHDNGEQTIEVDLRNNSTAYFDQHEDSVYLIASHPKLPLVATGGGDNLAYLWTTHSTPPRVAAKLEGHDESVIAGGFTADGEFLVTGDMKGKLIGWRSRAGGQKWENIGSTQEVDEIVYIVFHPTLPMVAAGAADGSVWVYDFSAASGEPAVENTAVLTLHSMATTAAVFVPGDELKPRLTTVSEDATIVLWDVYEGRAIYTLGPTQLRGEHPWVTVTLSPTARTFAAGSVDGEVVIVKVDDGTLLQTLDTASVRVPVGVASASSEQSDTPKELDEDSKSVEGLAWSDKTGLLATGNVEGIVTLWDASTWRPRTVFQIGDSVTSLKFVKGTNFLVVSGMDGTLVQFDAVSGERVWEMHGHNEGVLGFAVQEQGNRIISAGDEGVSLVFNKPV